MIEVGALSKETKAKISVGNKKAAFDGKNPARNKAIKKQIENERLERESDTFYLYN